MSRRRDAFFHAFFFTVAVVASLPRHGHDRRHEKQYLDTVYRDRLYFFQLVRGEIITIGNILFLESFIKRNWYIINENSPI